MLNALFHMEPLNAYGGSSTVETQRLQPTGPWLASAVAFRSCPPAPRLLVVVTLVPLCVCFVCWGVSASACFVRRALLGAYSTYRPSSAVINIDRGSYTSSWVIATLMVIGY